MSEAGSTGLGGGLSTYLHALREVAAHLYPRVKFIRLAFERLAGSKQITHPVRSVLFLCKGNICRSPLAEVYFRDQAQQNGHILTVRSAGIETTPGKPAHKLARNLARQHGISLESHTTTPLFPDLIRQSDLVLVMEVEQKDRVTRLYPEARQKLFVLGRFCSRGSLDIDDPYNGTEEDFKLCFQRIQESCDQVLHQIHKACQGQLGSSRSAENSRAQVG